jgi:hypothetical protein
VFQSVRAAMLAHLLWRPPGLDESTLVDELADMVLRYLVRVTPAEARPCVDATQE